MDGNIRAQGVTKQNFKLASEIADVWFSDIYIYVTHFFKFSAIDFFSLCYLVLPNSEGAWFIIDLQRTQTEWSYPAVCDTNTAFTNKLSYGSLPTRPCSACYTTPSDSKHQLFHDPETPSRTVCVSGPGNSVFKYTEGKKSVLIVV